MKAPTLILGFDDCHIDEWHSILDLLQKYDMKATFYISNLESILVDQWSKLREIADRGHTIGFHGLNHVRAGYTIEILGEKCFLDTEISPGLEIMDSYGFSPQHYSYPYGNRSEYSDSILLRIFRTLRTGGKRYFTAEEFEKAELLPGSDMGKNEECQFGWHEQAILYLKKINKIAVYYMHQPIVWRLEYIGKVTKENGIGVCGL